MEKVEKKVEGQESIEYMRLKNNLKNNENAALVHNLHQTFNSLYEKTEAHPKINHILSALAGPGSLASLLRSIRKREDY